MLYTSEITGKTYKTVEELEAAEKEFKKEEEKKQKALSVKRERAKEIEKAWEEFEDTKKRCFKEIRDAEEKFHNLRDSFAKDYGGYHMTYECKGEEEPKVTFSDFAGFVFPDLAHIFLK